jgi:hypothetical protein
MPAGANLQRASRLPHMAQLAPDMRRRRPGGERRQGAATTPRSQGADMCDEKSSKVNYPWSRLLLWISFMACVSCRGPDSHQDARPPQHAGSHGPGPGDSLAKLSRMLLTDSNPRHIAQAIACEHVRLGRLYGSWRASAIAKEVRDTIYTADDDSARIRVDGIIGASAFDLSCGYPRDAAPQQPSGDSR